MKSYIKWILMVLGLSRGNFVGGFIGFTIGYFIEEYLDGNLQLENKEVFEQTENKYSPYQNRLLALISEVVKADGYINKEEIYYIKNYLLNQFGSIYTNMMLKTLKLTVDQNHDIEAICAKLKISIDKTEKLNMLKFLYGITLQNGNISFKEKILLESISTLIGLTKSEFQRITKLYANKESEKKAYSPPPKRDYGFDPYKVLEIKSTATDVEVKKAYRKLVLKFHPDKTDIDDEIANEKFTSISKAYHIIKKRRNIK